MRKAEIVLSRSCAELAGIVSKKGMCLPKEEGGGRHKQEWQAQQKAQKEDQWMEEAELDGGGGAGEPGEAEGAEDDLPFACYICRKPWAELTDPVVTRCKCAPAPPP